MDRTEAAKDDRPLARKRPGVVLLVYAYRLVAALLVASPLALLIGGAVSGYPRGDAVLFDPGGLLLIEALRTSAKAMPPVVASSALIFVVACFAGLLPLGALLGALGARGRVTARDLGAFALRPIGTFSLLLGAFAIVEVGLAAIVIGVGSAIARRNVIDVRASDQLRVAFVVVALVLVLLVGVLHDLARVSSVRDELGFRASLRRAFATFRRAPLSVLGDWFGRALVGAILIGAAIVVGSRLGVDRGGQVFAGFLVHQASILGALFLRASWLAAAMRRVDRASEASVSESGADVVTEAEAAPSEEPMLADADGAADVEPAAALAVDAPLPVDEAPGAELVAPEPSEEKIDEGAPSNA